MNNKTKLRDKIAGWLLNVIASNIASKQYKQNLAGVYALGMMELEALERGVQAAESPGRH